MDVAEKQLDELRAKRPLWKRLLKGLLWLAFGLLIAVVSLIALVFVYEDEIKARVIGELNKNLLAEVRIQPKDIDVTVISSFPRCALNFRNITLLEALPVKERDTLLFTKELSLLFSIKDIFNKNYNIQRIAVKDGFCRLSVNRQGLENYQIWKSDTSKTASPSLRFSLDNITLKAFHLNYRNKPSGVIANAQIEDMTFSGHFYEGSFDMDSKAKAVIEQLKIRGIQYVRGKNLNYDVTLQVKNNLYAIKKARVNLNAMRFNVKGQFRIGKHPDMDLVYTAEHLEISNILSLLPEKEQKRVQDYKSDGEFYTSGDLHYHNDSLSYMASFGIKNGRITYLPKNISLTNVNLTGQLLSKGKQTELTCRNITAAQDNNYIKGSFSLVNFDQPYLELQAQVESDLKRITELYPIDTISAIEGRISGSVDLKGRISDLQKGRLNETIGLTGNVAITNCLVQFKKDPETFTIPECEISADNQGVKIHRFKLLRGKSDVSLNGELPSFIRYLFNANEPLIIKARLDSKQLYMSDFMNTSSSGTSSEIIFPQNNHFVFDASIDAFQFGKFEARQITGNIECRDNKALLSDLRFETADGTANADALAEFKENGIYLNLQSQLSGLNISQLFRQLNNFGQSTLQDKHIKGFISANIDFSGRWDKFLKPDPSSLLASATLTVERGELIDFKPLESLSRFVELNELKRIKFSTLESQINIKNQLITLPKTSLKNSALNIEFWGTHDFDNHIDYHVQLLLSELLSKRHQGNKALDEELSLIENDPENKRSVFILMSGIIDNPVIRYDRKGMKQKIKEDIRQEKQTLKALLKEEFGMFKKDSLQSKKDTHRKEQVFKIEKGSDRKKDKNETEPPEDEDF